MEKHLKEREIINPKTGKVHKNKKGIVGCHNEVNFMNEKPLIKSTGKIYDINGNEIPWVKEVTYSVPELDRAGNPIGTYAVKTNPKTIYDPKLISDKEYARRGIEAANDALSNSPSGVLGREWTGIDGSGVKWKGNYENGEITTMFPTN
nr:CdiA family toxin C-terminal domain-containing protein [Sebaldella sp. S0638]